MVLKVLDDLWRGRFKKTQGEADYARVMAEEAARDRPEYSPEEQKEIVPIWAEPIAGNEPNLNELDQHIDTFFEKHPEHIRTLAYYCFKYGFDLPVDKAKKYAEIVATNKGYLYHGFQSPEVFNTLIADAKRMKQGVRERNWVKIVLDNPAKYKKIFEKFRQRPPGVVEFMTEQEWNHPPKRRSGPSSV